MTTSRLLVAGLAALSLAACSSRHSYTDTNAAAPVSEFDRLARCITGTFANAEQAEERAADGQPVWMNVELHIVEIHPTQYLLGVVDTSTSSRWFYVEQAEVSVLDKPYRQHISEVRETGEHEFTARVYTFTGDPLRFAGWCDHPERFARELSPADLEHRTGCESVMRSDGRGGFHGGTVGAGCVNTSKGASYATSEITIMPGTGGCLPSTDAPTQIHAWDRGFDASGTQVWGSTTGPYIFVKK